MCVVVRDVVRGGWTKNIHIFMCVADVSDVKTTREVMRTRCRTCANYISFDE